MINPLIILIETGLTAGLFLAVLVGIFQYVERGKKRRGGKKQKEAEKKLEEIKEKVEPIAVTIPAIPIEGAANPLAQFPIGKTVMLELTKVKREENGTERRITIVTARVNFKPGLLNRKIPHFFPYSNSSYYLKPSKLIEVQVNKGVGRNKATIPVLKLVYDVMYSEPLNQNGTIDFDEEIETLLADSEMDQLIAAATLESGFEFTPALKTAIMILSILGGFLGIATNAIAQLTPRTLIHWVPVIAGLVH